MGSPATAALRLRHRTPLAVAPLRRYLAAHAVPGLERHDPVTGEHTRVVPGRYGPAVVTVRLGPEPGYVTARLQLADEDDRAPVVARVRRWLDLDADPSLIDGALGADPVLGQLVATRPGLRVPGAVDGVETALCAVLGQQISLAAACTLAGRLVAAYGTPVAEGLTAFPTAEALVAAGPDTVRSAVGLTRARSHTVHALAQAVVDGLVLDASVDRSAARVALLALPGIGPWTAEYVALRSLGDPDAFPADDLVLKRSLGVRSGREAAAHALAWRPWRGYALMHLWTRAVFA